MNFGVKIEKAIEWLGLEWQYVLMSPNYPYRFKVGHTSKFSDRILDIRYTMSSEAGRNIRVWMCAKLPVFKARVSEKAIHKMASWKPAKGMPGSGYTEWSWSVNGYAMLITYGCSFIFDYPHWVALVVLALPVPIDFVIFSLTLALIQYAFAGLAVYGAFKLFF